LDALQCFPVREALVAGRLQDVSDGASAGLWGCSIAGAAAAVHQWGAGGSASSLEGRWRRLPMRGLLTAALAAAHQRNYGRGIVGAAGGGSASVGQRWRVSYVQQPTIDGRGEGGWWSRSRGLMGDNTTTSRGGRE